MEWKVSLRSLHFGRIHLALVMAMPGDRLDEGGKHFLRGSVSLDEHSRIRGARREGGRDAGVLDQIGALAQRENRLGVAILVFYELQRVADIAQLLDRGLA